MMAQRLENKVARNSFTVVELLIASALVGVLTTLVYGGMRLHLQTEEQFTCEYRAAQVLDNVVERIEAATQPDCVQVTALAEHEFEESGLARCGEIAIHCTEESGCLLLCISGKGRRSLASVRIPLK